MDPCSNPCSISGPRRILAAAPARLQIAWCFQTLLGHSPPRCAILGGGGIPRAHPFLGEEVVNVSVWQPFPHAKKGLHAPGWPM